MGIDAFEQEKNLAQRLLEKENLKVPFDLYSLASKYAKVIYKPIPIEGVDGVCLNLKTPGKTPTIIVNSNHTEGRQRFTLAHELGHVIIPWHLGTIVDDIYSSNFKEFAYGLQEQEANSFAAELLMPGLWVTSLYDEKNDLSEIQGRIVKDAKVSAHAAAIAMMRVLPSNIIYAAVDGGEVLHSGKTYGSAAFPPTPGTVVGKEHFPYRKSFYIYHASHDYLWWDLNGGIKVEVDDERSWREILEEIISDIDPEEGREAFIRSLSGIVGSAKSMLRNEKFNLSELTASMLYRLRRDDLKSFSNHKDFEIFVQKRAKEIFERNK